jgi:peptidoglycan hydrolase-like protein with peptidoglycan-binding domain
MKYPGRIIKAGEADARTVKALEQALNRSLALRGAQALRLDAANPTFGPLMRQAVRLFQARNVDADGRPLKVDGVVGSITWAALFGADAVPRATRSDDAFLSKVLEIAAGEEARQVRERPRNSNRGPEVDRYLRSAGVRPGHAWCCAFVYWCFAQAGQASGRPNPMFRTAGCLAHWNGAPSVGARRVLRRQAVDDPGLVQPGMVFVMDFGGGLGHTGFVSEVDGGHLVTIEGNTDASKTREGGGVYRLRRKLLEVNRGFIDYAGV